MKRKGHFKVTPGPGGSVRIESDGVVWFLSVEQARVLGALLSVQPPAEILTLRAKVIAVGGKRPRARLASPFEANGEVFGIDITEDVGRSLAEHLYRDVEAAIRVQRDGTGKIQEGRLLSFVPVKSGNAFESWREWLKENGPEWDEVENIER